jgi:hypothetical protein
VAHQVDGFGSTLKYSDYRSPSTDNPTAPPLRVADQTVKVNIAPDYRKRKAGAAKRAGQQNGTWATAVSRGATFVSKLTICEARRRCPRVQWTFRSAKCVFRPFQKIIRGRILIWRLKAQHMTEREMQIRARLPLEEPDESMSQRARELLTKADNLGWGPGRQESIQEIRTELESIGNKLCSIGGLPRMTQVAYRVSALGQSISGLGVFWDGICGWQN